MYLHIGNNRIVNTDNIIGIFDLDNSSYSYITKEYIKKAEREKNIFYTTYELPRSMLVEYKNGVQRVYITQLSTTVINKRIENKEIFKD